MKNPLYLIFFLSILFSCKKESYTSNAAFLLRTDADTLHFDTVFTTAGSVTGEIKIFNDNSKGIHIGKVRLAGGTNSPFKINVNGEQGPEAAQIDLDAYDSTYIFVTVRIDPSSANLPFQVKDSIEISYNGNTQYIQLDAYGRNAHFLRNKIVSSDEAWPDDLPYVILGSLIVDSNATLTLNEGCRLYMHADAPFIVHGSLQALGSDNSRIIFTGDRTDDPYKNFPGSYPGIIFSGESRNNLLQFCTIKNAYQGIVVQDAWSGGTKLTLNETIIDNAYDAGLLAMNSTVTGTNVLISNCGKDLELIKGGDYSFTHCTITAYSNNYIQHRDPLLILANNDQFNAASYNMKATFRNCLFWTESNGLVDNDIFISKTGTTTFDLTFDHVLWNTVNNPPYVTVISPIYAEPLFDSINTAEQYYDFHVKDNSPAIDAGMDAGVTTDLDGRKRPVGLPDLGCYEKQ